MIAGLILLVIGAGLVVLASGGQSGRAHRPSSPDNAARPYQRASGEPAVVYIVLKPDADIAAFAERHQLDTGGIGPPGFEGQRRVVLAPGRDVAAVRLELAGDPAVADVTEPLEGSIDAS
jgi:hypothetical protein